MKKKSQKDLLKIIADFQKILKEKPSLSQMLDELRMMKVRVHSLSGNITSFNLANKQLIEVIWGLSKLDELFQTEFKKLSFRDKNLFMRVLNGIYQKLQDRLNGIDFKTNEMPADSIFLEMELFKEQKRSKKLN